jgi:transposase
VEVKEVVVGDGEARTRYIMVRNPQQEKKDRQEREQVLEHLEAELKALRSPKSGGHGKDACRLLTHATYGAFLKPGRAGLPMINRDKVKALERLDGKYLLRTSDDTLTAGDVALGYKQLLEVEAAFRSLKQTLQLRPMHHRLSRRIRAHVVICWMALLLVRVAEHRVELGLKEAHTWDRMRRELDRMHLGTLGGPLGTFQLRSETRPFQAQLLTAMKVPEPPKVHGATPAVL